MRKLIMGGLLGVLGVLMFASTALGSSHNPKGEYAQFEECPLNRTTITDCVFSVTSSGSFTIGKKTVPIVNPVTLQGGFEGEEAGIEFYGAENGDTLSKTPQPVPGGLLGITAPTWWPKFIQDWFNKQINKGFTGVNATVELTGPTKGLTNIKLNTENLLLESGTALGLPVKFHLENAILGSGCYIGSESRPVQINFTTGTSGALKGAAGHVDVQPSVHDHHDQRRQTRQQRVRGSGANGCGGIFSFFVDPLVNSILGLPAGRATTPRSSKANCRTPRPKR